MPYDTFVLPADWYIVTQCTCMYLAASFTGVEENDRRAWLVRLNCAPKHRGACARPYSATFFEIAGDMHHKMLIFLNKVL